VTLTFDPVTLGCGPSLRKVGQGILELLIANEKVTDGQTNMCKAIGPLFFEGGHKKVELEPKVMFDIEGILGFHCRLFLMYKSQKIDKSPVQNHSPGR